MTPQQALSDILKDAARRRTNPEENETDEWNASIKRMEERKAENDRLAREANASRFEHNNGNNHPNPTKKKPEKKPRGRFGVVLAEVMENPDSFVTVERSFLDYCMLVSKGNGNCGLVDFCSRETIWRE